MNGTPSRTRTVLTRGLLILGAIYGVLWLVTGHPIRSLLGEVVGVVLLWALYVVRFMSSDPRALLPEVLWFQLQDRLHPPAPGSVVFTGSSTIGHWTSLERDMAPVPVLNRGINGAQLHQIDWLLDRLVFPYKPSAVVLYAGENDLAGFLGSEKKSPEEVACAFEEFCHAVHAELPGIPIYFISIKPPKTRMDCKEAFETTNRIVREFCGSDSTLHYIDAVPALVDPEGKGQSSLYEFDGIHLNEAGYRVLAGIVRQALTLG